MLVRRKEGIVDICIRIGRQAPVFLLRLLAVFAGRTGVNGKDDLSLLIGAEEAIRADQDGQLDGSRVMWSRELQGDSAAANQIVQANWRDNCR